VAPHIACNTNKARRSCLGGGPRTSSGSQPPSAPGDLDLDFSETRDYFNSVRRVPLFVLMQHVCSMTRVLYTCTSPLSHYLSSPLSLPRPRTHTRARARSLSLASFLLYACVGALRTDLYWPLHVNAPRPRQAAIHSSRGSSSSSNRVGHFLRGDGMAKDVEARANTEDATTASIF
jgi:hypothetical protein